MLPGIFIPQCPVKICTPSHPAASGFGLLGSTGTAQGERQLADRRDPRGAKARTKRPSQRKWEGFVGQEAIAVTQVEKHRGPAVPEHQPEQTENHSPRSPTRANGIRNAFQITAAFLRAEEMMSSATKLTEAPAAANGKPNNTELQPLIAVALCVRWLARAGWPCASGASAATKVIAVETMGACSSH